MKYVPLEKKTSCISLSIPDRCEQILLLMPSENYFLRSSYFTYIPARSHPCTHLLHCFLHFYETYALVLNGRQKYTLFLKQPNISTTFLIPSPSVVSTGRRW